MAWVKLSDQYADDWRLAAVSPDAECVFLRLLACSNRMLADGLLDAAIVRQQVTARLLDTVAGDAAIDDLARVGLIRAENVSGRPAWRLASEFIAWQPTRERVQRDRERWRLEQQRQREAAATQPKPKRRRRSAQDDAEKGRLPSQGRNRRPDDGEHGDADASPHSESSAVRRFVS